MINVQVNTQWGPQKQPHNFYVTVHPLTFSTILLALLIVHLMTITLHYRLLQFTNFYSSTPTFTHEVQSIRLLYLSINQGSQRKVVKEISEVLPDIGVTILSQALIIKSIHLSDLSALMIAS